MDHGGEERGEHRCGCLVTEAGDLHHHGAGDSGGERDAMVDRIHRICGSVNHERRVHDLAKPIESARRAMNRSTMAGFGFPPGEEFSPSKERSFTPIERVSITREQLTEFDQPLDPTQLVGWRANEQPASHLLDKVVIGAREPLVTRSWRRADERQGLDSVGMLDRKHLTDHAAHRAAHDVSLFMAEDIKQTDRVRGEILEQVACVGPEPLRPAAITMIKPDNLEAGVDQTIDKTRVPTEPGRIRSGQQQGQLTLTGDINPKVDVTDPNDIAAVDVSCCVDHETERYRWPL